MLIKLLEQNNNYPIVYPQLYKTGQIIHGLTNPAKSIVLATLLAKATQPIIFVCSNHHEALDFYREVTNLSDRKVYNFSSHEVSPYDQINSDTGVLSSQYEVFEALAVNEICCVIATFKSLSQLYINKEIFNSRKITLSVDLEIEPSQLALDLVMLGYHKDTMVESRGQFSQRGDITDIYPIVGEPIRIEFFGDKIESIRVINIQSQRSIQKLDSVLIHPRYSLVRSIEDGLADKILELAAKHKVNELLEPEYQELLVQDLYWEGIEYYREFLGQGASTFFEFIPSHSFLICDEWQDLANLSQDWQNKQDELYQAGVKANKLIPLTQVLHLGHSEIAKQVTQFKSKLYLQTVLEPGMVLDKQDSLSYELMSYPTERFASKVEEFVHFIKDKLREKQTVIVYSEQPQRVMGIFREWDIQGNYYEADAELNPTLGQVIVQRDGLEEGCKLPIFDLVILTDRELFGRSRQAIARQKTQKQLAAANKREIYTDIADLKIGDYVVHYKHGIGRYQGTEFVEINYARIRNEYLVIEYADEARILLPVDQVNLLSRFNVNQEVKPRLSRLGSSDWERTKKKVKKSVKKIAQDLVNLYAVRQKQTGYQYPPDTPWQIEMEDAFPYTETEDQLHAINMVKDDMESVKLMDRLICGDAGFGKTEVIIRGVFKTIMEGRQAAILVPTTVLAQQHYNVFSDRYAPYPIRIGLLSRFKTPKEQAEVVAKLKIGELDLVIGTHRLLQKDIKFHNIGLLVIDEEQRFGVSHKEKLKEIRRDLDVISMSATPIPRTLHMSLSGIRDISLIGTPPTNRKPVKTFVGESRDSIITNAILHELERGGKIFFVHNRVENIDEIAFKVQGLVPEAKIRVAHGQMGARELEDVMFSFVNNEFDVMVCTTIIETGLDIADANTIIINNANTFGLSQLYQLRGRVGRSDQQAYAYLLFDPAKDMSDNARERLRAIRELTNLGSGYQIAIRDMEIRGVGNVFGAEQHGHMLSVGFDLYCKILSDTIEEMKGNLDASSLESGCVIDIKINAYFPELWISDKRQRMNEYKRLSLCRDEAILDQLVNEWQDRFGKLPVEAINLIEVSRLKILANKAGIKSINQDVDVFRIVTDIRLQQWLQIQRSLGANLQSRLSFKAAAVGSRNSESMIMVKAVNLESSEKVEILRDIILALKNK